jgi:trans-2,3-dihydro-3-hydroxyanthranilate isomerase
MKLSYLLLDVFTTERLKGNPLAVVCKADGLLDDEMQAVAREFNLSETVFLLKPRVERNTAAVRIFTPTVELPFAGHPTVGAAVVMALQNKCSVVRLEETIGLVTTLVERRGTTGGEARFTLPQLPKKAGRAPSKRAIASALGLKVEDIGCGTYKPEVYSAGVVFYLVPVKDAEALRRISCDLGEWEETFPLARHSVYAFTETPGEPDNDFAARMFAPGMGLTEDPGTGSAAAALIGLIAANAGTTGEQRDYVVRQGLEMGRLCRITMQMRKEGNELVHAGICGDAVIIAEGVLDLGD